METRERPNRLHAELLTAGSWSTRHGVARLAMNRARKQGDLQARLFSDRSTREDPFPLYTEIRDRAPIVRGSFLAATAHHHIAGAVLRSDAFGVVSDPDALPPAARWMMTRPQRTIGPVTPPSMLAVDPPVHTRYRRLVSRVFTARAMASMRERVGELADELLDRAGPEPDLVRDYASLLPVTIIAEILGVPAAMRAQFVAWGSAAAPVLDIGLSYREYRRVDHAIRQLNDWMSGHFARLRHDPGDDLISRLIHDDNDLDENELLAIAGLLLAAGFETTVNLIGNGAALLMSHRDQLDGLDWGNAVEEILRYESPVQNTARRALRDTEVAGVPVRKGTFLSILIGGANRDPAVFDDPERFDVHRANAKEHLAFSSGVHYCLGASLARIEGEEALRRLFERYPDVTLAGPVRRRPTRTLRGYDELPVRLT
ncbi:cytochrome P450 [Cryptosporangium arvum]|uniref:cytochrome P450 n=1 Tax=Cryptosporangium arvum TaxID=80871 RepID=UPI0004BBFEBF|nr:cytochrome P450 [Cryptosporangium arvum]